jgi:ribosomal-protein-serine acetyltransferase
VVGVGDPPVGDVDQVDADAAGAGRQRAGLPMGEPRSARDPDGHLLEPVAPDHANALSSAVMESWLEVLPWMPWAREPSLDGNRRAAEDGERTWHEDRMFHFVMVERATLQVIGVVGLDRAESEMAELHYWIRSDHARRGLTTEACSALIAWAPGDLGVRRLTLWAGRDNRASRRVPIKLSFSDLGPLDWRPEGGLGTFKAERYQLELS